MMRTRFLALLCTPALGLLVLSPLSFGCKGSSGDDKGSPAQASPGKAKPQKGQLSEEPQVLFDAKTGKTNTIIWPIAGKEISFRVQTQELNGNLSALVFAESDGESKHLHDCFKMDKERGDRIELMLRDDSDPRVAEILHFLCIRGGEPGHTEAVKRYVSGDDDSLDLGYIEGYEGKGLIYEPVKDHADALYLTSLAAGTNHICGIRKDGRAVCWGEGDGGQLDAPEGNFTKLDVSPMRSCGIKADNSVTCWGRGLGPVDQPPVEPPEGTYVDIAVGYTQMCGIGTDGKTQCWWTVEPEAPKKETTSEKIIAIAVEQGDIEVPKGDFLDVETTDSVTCGVLKEGAVKCWGNSVFGLISGVPDGKFKQISLHYLNACALSVDNTISCWGSMIENGHALPKGTFTQVSVGDGFACGVASDKSIQCWGSNDSKQLEAPAGKFANVATGDGFACAIKDDAKVVCWGQDGRGNIDSVVTRVPLF